MSFNILVVDDSAVMRAIVIRVLKLSKLALGEIREAGNGEEALAAIKEHWIDLALVDLNMPVMDGEELLERLRRDETTRGLKVIIVSSESDQERIRHLERRTAGFIHKPFTPEAIRAKIMEVMGGIDERRSERDPVSDDGGDF